MTTKILFPHDNKVLIVVPTSHTFTDAYSRRPYHEVLFRRIHTYLIKIGIIEKDKNIIDLGAWIGDNTLPWSKLIDGIIYAIDPSSDNCAYIKQLAELNQVKNVKIIQLAISDTKKTLSTNGNINHCSFEYDSPGENGKHKVESTSLDNLYSEGIITKLGYIHLDVEGMEHTVIAGAKKLIDELRPVITYEQHLDLDKHIDQIKKRFIAANYKVFMINEILPGCRTDCRNLIAIPSEKLTDTFVSDLVTDLSNNTDQVGYCVAWALPRAPQEGHKDYTVNTQFYPTLDQATKHFDKLNGGEHAAIMAKKEKTTGIKILKTYGQEMWVKACSDHLQQKGPYFSPELLIAQI